jgi:hypothetical protein
MTRPPAVLRSALALMSVRLVLQQIGLALIVFLLCILWLRMPDASAIEVVASGLLGLLVLAIAGAGESAIMLHLAGAKRTPWRLLRGALWVLAGAALWFGWTALLGHVRGNDFTLAAGYVNSRFPHQLRYIFTFEHILLWLGWFCTTLVWIGFGVIALLVFVATASVRPRRALLFALRSLTCWLGVVLGAIGAAVITDLLMQWTPGRGLRVEMLSLVLRLSFTVLLDATLVCFLLAMMAVFVRHADLPEAAPQSTPAGTPEESQPRTADSP